MLSRSRWEILSEAVMRHITVMLYGTATQCETAIPCEAAAVAGSGAKTETDVLRNL